MMLHTKYSCHQSAFCISENHLFTACILPQRGNISVEKNIPKEDHVPQERVVRT
jgi:hypothetical protein